MDKTKGNALSSVSTGEAQEGRQRTRDKAGLSPGRASRVRALEGTGRPEAACRQAVGTYLGVSNGCRATSSISGTPGGAFWLL